MRNRRVGGFGQRGGIDASGSTERRRDADARVAEVQADGDLRHLDRPFEARRAVGDRCRAAAEVDGERILVEEGGIRRDDARADEIGTEGDRAVDGHPGRQVVEHVAEPSWLLLLDLDRQEVARTPGDHDRPLVVEHAGRAEVRVVGQLVDHRVANVQLVRIRAGRPVGEEELADDLVGQRLAELAVLDGGIDGRLRPGRQVLEEHDGPAEDDGRLLEQLRRGVLDGSLEVAVLEAQVGLHQRDADRGLRPDRPQRPEADVEVAHARRVALQDVELAGRPGAAEDVAVDRR